MNLDTKYFAKTKIDFSYNRWFKIVKVLFHSPSNDEKLKKIAFLLFLSFYCFTSIAQTFSKSQNFFPIAVTLQAPYNIEAYNKAGVNIYCDLSWGPLDAYHLDLLHKSNMYVICAQDSFALTKLNDTLIYAWSLPYDEPDNAQWNPKTSDYDSCINPSVIIGDYKKYKLKDPTRPVILGLGQGVANSTWYGRGSCYNWLASYPKYLKGCDIGTFDIYPVNSNVVGITNNLWYVAKGMDSIIAWSANSNKPMWTWIETTKINTTSAGKPSPSQVKSEVWMALIHGARGIGYFTHSWNPNYVSGAVLLDTPMVSSITIINNQIRALASVLNSPNIIGYSTVSSNTAVPIDIMSKKYGGYNYIFSVAMRSGNTTATFHVASGISVEVIGENRSITITGGQFSDNFSSYGVHLYKIKGSSTGFRNMNDGLENEIKVFPNPAKDKLNIQVLKNTIKISKLILSNTIGQEILAIDQDEINMDNNTLNIKLLPEGIYILSIETDNGIIVKKVIKQ